MSTDTQALQRLAEFGQSVWIDYLSRELLESGELARLVREDAVVGVTSNPTIFEQAISHGDAYDAQLRELLPRGLSGKELFLELACADVAAGCDLLRPGVGAERRDGTATSRSRSIPLSPTTPSPNTRRRGGCTSGSSGRICSSRSPPRSPA